MRKGDVAGMEYPPTGAKEQESINQVVATPTPDHQDSTNKTSKSSGSAGTMGKLGGKGHNG